MKKNFLVLFAMMVLCIATASAQSIVGKWYLDESQLKMMDLGENIKMDFILDISQKNFDIVYNMEVTEDDVKMWINSKVPGTYVKKGNNMKVTFDTTKIDLKVVDFTSTDPEIAEMMKSPEGKKMFLELVNMTIKENMADITKDMAETAETLSEFTIGQLTAKKLTIKAGDEEMIFNRRTAPAK